MSYYKNTPKFFLGANSPSGFVSCFNHLYYPEDNWFCYIIKGGPGTGKSSLMKQIANYAINNNRRPELIYCSTDPNSLDAVILKDLKVSIVDGTAPHCLDPIYPGVTDKIINLGDYWDEKALIKHKGDILKTINKNTLFHKRASGYLYACKGVKNSIELIARKALNNEKILSFSKKIAKKLFKRKSFEKGKEKIRFISAITPYGIIFFEDTVKSLCSEIYVIEDKFRVASPIILEAIKNAALDLGHNVISCYCPLAPKDKLECLIFPEDKIAFAVSNPNHPLETLKSIGKKINATRFLDKELLSANIKLLNFDKKIEKELLNAAIENLKNAKDIHDSIESYYIPNMNFKEIDKLSKKLINEIF